MVNVINGKHGNSTNILCYSGAWVLRNLTVSGAWVLRNLTVSRAQRS